MVSSQLSAVSYQLSGISCRPSVIRRPRSANGRWSASVLGVIGQRQGDFVIDEHRSSVKRIVLPSRCWWEIRIRPLWADVRDWPCEGVGLIDHALASLSTAWSFPEKICVESISGREVDDLIAVIEVFRAEIAPHLLSATRGRDMAQRLLAGMVVGQIPRELEEAHIMAATGWSWPTLQATPVDVVQKMTIYLAATEARATQGSLDIFEAEGD